LDSSKEINNQDWMEFFGDMIKNVSLQNETNTKQAVFLLSDAQINDERYLEDINNLINIGEIPNLYSPEDKENVIEINI
jgi:dynein heavy chain